MRQSFMALGATLTLAMATPQLNAGTKAASRDAAEKAEGERQFQIWERENAKYERAVPRNAAYKEKALQALRKSAELEYPQGMFELASQLNWANAGPPTPEDDALRFRLLKRAAELGHLDAHVVLGIAYSSGRGVSANPVMYVIHQCVAARAGNSSAISNLQSSTVGEYAEFRRITLKGPTLLYPRPDFTTPGVSFLSTSQTAWEIMRYSDGWTAVYVPQGCIVGFVETREL